MTISSDPRRPVRSKATADYDLLDEAFGAKPSAANDPTVLWAARIISVALALFVTGAVAIGLIWLAETVL